MLQRNEKGWGYHDFVEGHAVTEWSALSFIIPIFSGKVLFLPFYLTSFYNFHFLFAFLCPGNPFFFGLISVKVKGAEKKNGKKKRRESVCFPAKQHPTLSYSEPRPQLLVFSARETNQFFSTVFRTHGICGYTTPQSSCLQNFKRCLRHCFQKRFT